MTLPTQSDPVIPPAALLLFLLASSLTGQVPPTPRTAPPPNGPARVATRGSAIELRYHGAVIFTGRLEHSGPAPTLRALVDSGGGRMTQILSWAGRGALTLRGTVHGSRDAFAVDAEPREDALPVVRHSVGPSYSQLNRGVYARSGDWLLSIDHPAKALVTPVAGGVSTAFTIEATGGEVTLRFRPRFYQRHRGLPYYQPWAYAPWPGSVAGWTSWFAFRDQVTEADIHTATDAIAERLAPFGYEYVQIDDGFQRLPIGVPGNWLGTNSKFPGGLQGLRDYIASHGLRAGLWTNVSFADAAFAAAHPSYFVRTPDGQPARGNWVGFVMDGANPATMNDLVLPVYRALKAQGWGYFKVDALRHLRYEGYNSHASHYAGRGTDRTRVFRSFVQQIRDVIGRDAFLLASWGPRPELAGIVDATRLGDDGFGYGGFAQFNSFNNVVWRNDPDHIELRQPDRYRATTLTSLTGSVMMLTDPPEVYRTDRAEAAKRAAPVLFTRPGQLYDVDASRSSLLHEAGRQTSGAGPRPFDADQRLVVPLYQLDIARSFEQWTVLARVGGDDPSIALSDLGLASATDYVGFEFWTKRALGVVRDTLRVGAVDPTFQVQVICLRERVAHPQLLATNRHVSCGGVDLVDVSWSGRALSGTSELVAGDAYELYLTEPAGFGAPSVQVEGAQVLDNARNDGVRTVRVLAPAGGRVRWRIAYP